MYSSKEDLGATQKLQLQSKAVFAMYPMAFSIPEAGRILSVSDTHIRKELRDGNLQSFASRGRVLISRESIEKYIKAREE